MILGLYTKKEFEKNERESYIKGYNNGYDDSNTFHEYCDNKMIKYVAELENELDSVKKENKHLKNKAREERHNEVRQLQAKIRNTKKHRVKKKCEARLLKIRLGR